MYLRGHKRSKHVGLDDGQVNLKKIKSTENAKKVALSVKSEPEEDEFLKFKPKLDIVEYEPGPDLVKQEPEPDLVKQEPEPDLVKREPESGDDDDERTGIDPLHEY